MSSLSDARRSLLVLLPSTVKLNVFCVFINLETSDAVFVLFRLQILEIVSRVEGLLLELEILVLESVPVVSLRCGACFFLDEILFGLR